METNKCHNENCLDTTAKMPDGFLDLSEEKDPSKAVIYELQKNFKNLLVENNILKDYVATLEEQIKVMREFL